jgi:hypothetical protein
MMGVLPGNCGATAWGTLGKADTLEEIFETHVVAQAVHAGIYMKIDEPVRAFFVGLLEVLDRTVVFTQTDVDSREEVR